MKNNFKMKYAIQNDSGQWWTGTCWGDIRAREEYTTDLRFNLPIKLPADNGSDPFTLYRWANSWLDEPLVAGYSLDADENSTAIVREVCK